MPTTCAAALMVAALASSAVANAEPTGAPATYSDRIGDAGRAPDIAAVTVTPASAERLEMTISLGAPTTLGRFDWIVVGVDTDRNPYTGGMHGSEVIVLVNGERAVVHRVGGAFTPVESRVTRDEVVLRVRLADLRVRTFDFAVATLRQDADVAPDYGVFTYPASSPHAPRAGHVPLKE